jgi:hypothetical protein
LVIKAKFNGNVQQQHDGCRQPLKEGMCGEIGGTAHAIELVLAYKKME